MHLSSVLPPFFRGFNQLSYGLDEIYLFFESEGIEIIETPGKHSFIFTAEGVSFIAYPRNLKGLELKFVLLHEIYHYLQSFGETPDRAYFHNIVDTRDEQTANVFALICMIPQPVLFEKHTFLSENPTPSAYKFFRERERVYFFYGV